MTNPTVEDYIKAVYKLEREGNKVSTSVLAGELKLADASITDMLKRLSEKGYVRYVPYQGVDLTPRGRRMALSIVRRHRLWEMFLVQFLDYSWDKVHAEAERLEHVTSDELERRLDKILRWPTVDPHGDPIPNARGEVEVQEGIPLSECAAGASVRILRVSDEDGELLEHAAKMGLTLNARIRVKQKMKFDGSMVVRVGSRERFLSKQVAQAIFVQPA
jgi:DtxR family Mn-dependent transcriptional regulator